MAGEPLLAEERCGQGLGGGRRSREGVGGGQRGPPAYVLPGALGGRLVAAPGSVRGPPFLLGHRAHRGEEGSDLLPPALTGGGNFLRVVFPGGMGGGKYFLFMPRGHGAVSFFLSLSSFDTRPVLHAQY